jgi:ribonuclease BN (tRNA processing enzyme)
MDRRTFLGGLGAMGIGAFAPRQGPAPKTRLILLGTAGGPRPKKNAAAPANALIVGDVIYVVDCGNGVARQLVAAGLSLPALRHVFVTHQHSDHTADYGNLIWLAWAAGLKTRVDTWGPPPLEKMTRLFFEMNAVDIDTRIADEGRLPLSPLVHVHELTAGGSVMADEQVRVTAAVVSHPPLVPALAYRFDAPGRSIVFSGDTARSDALVALARGADVLVHEALFLPAVDRIVATVSNASTLKKHLLDSHTSAEDCGRVAQAAGVKLLVLSHLVPVDDPQVTDAMWVAAVRTHFTGQVIVGKDLLEI